MAEKKYIPNVDRKVYKELEKIADSSVSTANKVGLSTEQLIELNGKEYLVISVRADEGQEPLRRFIFSFADNRFLISPWVEQLTEEEFEREQRTDHKYSFTYYGMFKNEINIQLDEKNLFDFLVYNNTRFVNHIHYFNAIYDVAIKINYKNVTSVSLDKTALLNFFEPHGKDNHMYLYLCLSVPREFKALGVTTELMEKFTPLSFKAIQEKIVGLSFRNKPLYEKRLETFTKINFTN